VNSPQAFSIRPLTLEGPCQNSLGEIFEIDKVLKIKSLPWVPVLSPTPARFCPSTLPRKTPKTYKTNGKSTFSAYETFGFNSDENGPRLVLANPSGILSPPRRPEADPIENISRDPCRSFLETFLFFVCVFLCFRKFPLKRKLSSSDGPVFLHFTMTFSRILTLA
jgi:hypothetical protein